MNQIKELEIKCSIEDHDYAQLVCLNKECKANRVYCDQCLRNGDHIAHINDQWNIQKLILIFQNIEKESETLKSDLCLINQEINKIFTQLNQKITKKYQYSKERLQKLDAKQLHQILNYIIKYEEVEKSVLNEVKKCSDDMIMQIKRQKSYSLKIQEKQNTTQLFQKGYQLYQEDNEYEEAIKLFDDALFINPDHLNSITSKAECLKQLKNYNDAILYIDRALSIDSVQVDSLYTKAQCIYMLDNFNDAILWCDKGLFIDPKHINSLQTKAECLRMLGDYKDAILWADKVLSIDSKNVNSLHTKGLNSVNKIIAECLKWLDNYKDAILWADKALSINSKHINSLFTKGESLRMLGEYEDAIKILDVALNQNPNHDQSLVCKGACLQSLQKYQEAINCYNQAIQINPNYQFVQNQKIVCENQLKKQQIRK